MSSQTPSNATSSLVLSTNSLVSHIMAHTSFNSSSLLTSSLSETPQTFLIQSTTVSEARPQINLGVNDNKLNHTATSSVNGAMGFGGISWGVGELALLGITAVEVFCLL
ncbi:hypothetical protein DASC09_009850 [Saccharomycopsis crataegensis]|uniref:Uncharacterized protein n=1 Tax=Saccharomycopsis crataegensis TaxID=43959 RepID=A0AAV5QGT7_9ASCO|nr:hypothetical protein DASC09_009850 [Saccharomycopsis crataegensis]